jgi:protein-L-isoaspartate(D-aspartate) O-methyltransferase
MSSLALREHMVDGLVANGSLRSSRVREAFLSVRREEFLPVIAEIDGLEHVYWDTAIVVREREGVPVSSSSQPSMMAQMLESLDVRPGSRVLEVGLGTGYNAALLSELAGPQGRVTSIDIDPELVRKATDALRRAGCPAETATGDGRQGWPAGAPYDRMIVTASTDTIPIAWWRDLAVGGLLVVPVRLGVLQMIITFERTADGFRSVDLLQGSFMPLYGCDGADQRVATISVRVAAPGSRAVMVSATAPGIATMSTGMKQRLLSNLISVPASHEVGPFAAWPLVWHMLLHLDEEHQVCIGTEQPGVRVGIVDGASGRCEVLVAAHSDGNDWLVERAEVYGEPHDAPAIARFIAHWEEDGRPGLERLKFFVDYHDQNSPMGLVRVSWL